MSAGLLGAVFGLALALFELWLLRSLSQRVDMPESKRVLRIVGLAQLVLFPVAGYFLGRSVFGD